ncbi:MAG: hypothetical protein KDC13_06750 [Bacteroidetes bacterium]|nr:hypothetical protein [Bacteroidota bacterium]
MFSIHNLCKISIRAAALVLLVFSGGLSNLKAQGGLVLNYFNIPDTLYFDTSVPVDFSITNNTDSSLLGNLQINFLNETFNNVQAPLGGFEAVQFFAPFQEREFSTLIPVEPQYFLEGGNTVVIWPSFVGQPVQAEDSIRVTVIVTQSNGVTSNPPSLSEHYFIPNPLRNNQLSITPKNGAALPEKLMFYDISGKFLLEKQTSGNSWVEVGELPDGVLFIRALLPDGRTGMLKLVKISTP